MMKREGLVLVSLIGLVLLLLMSGCTTTEQTATLYRVGIDAAYQPFSMVGPDGKATGFDVDSMKWIAKDQGLEVEFVPIAWDGIIPALQAGKINLIYAGMTITEERKEKVNFSKPYWTVNQMVVVKEGSSITLDQVKNGSVVIGTQRGCTAAIWIDENLVNQSLMPAENLKLYDNTPLAVDDLVSGRIDAVMYDSTVMNDIIAGKPVTKIGMVETNEDFGIAVRKEDTALLEKLNNGLDNLMVSPEWEVLKQKYNMEGESRSSIAGISTTDSYEEPIDVEYEEIARYPEKYINHPIHIKGRIIQTIDENNGKQTIRLATESNEIGKNGFGSGDVILIDTNNKNHVRLLEDDIIDVTFISKGLKSYQSVVNQKITVPSGELIKLEIIS